MAVVLTGNVLLRNFVKVLVLILDWQVGMKTDLLSHFLNEALTVIFITCM